MTKVVFVLPGILGGGAEKIVLNLYRALETHKQYECHILSLSRGVAHAVDTNQRIHYLDEISGISKRGFARLTYRKAISSRVDDYIDNNIGKDCVVFSNMMFADKVMSLSRHRVFHVIHNSYTQALLDGKPFYRRFFIRRNINNIYRNHPLIFVSCGALESFCASFNADVEKHVIYNPLNDLDIYALATAGPAELDCDYIIHIGRFNRQKRHDRLLKAFAKVRADIRLVLLGEGRLEQSIRALIAELGLDERVLLMGFKPNPYPLLRKAKALVLCSDFEGLPTVIIEAISLGTPVVTTDCPSGIREIIDPASPSLVPLHDSDALARAIEGALLSPDKYRSALDDRFSSRFAAGEYDKLIRAAQTGH